MTNGLLGAFAVAAFVLAAIGIYGVISLGVAARTREFGVRISALDLPTFAAATAILGIIALVACFIPARRATQADPLTALRAD